MAVVVDDASSQAHLDLILAPAFFLLGALGEIA